VDPHECQGAFCSALPCFQLLVGVIEAVRMAGLNESGVISGTLLLVATLVRVEPGHRVGHLLLFGLGPVSIV